MRLLRSNLAVIVAGLLAATPAFAQPAAAGPEPFAPEIEAFAAHDRAAPPAFCQIVFTGSSSVRFWTSLARDMAPIPVINRGFGGSQISDVNAYFDRVVGAYHPRAVVFYAGENDIHAGEGAAEAVADFERFMALKTAKLGATPVYFISLKPSKARLGEKPRQDEVNAKIRALADARADLDYIDVVPAMLEADGRPKDIFIADGLHMTPAGYALWTAVVRPVVETAAKIPCG
ncbi:MAG: GDSL-type esterase/lipase family protein [Pseudomonadota bacterium]|uniref:GDSL-type esterase/lipase family protein n=1 Tax=unclassified Phenylobacterium TaxID=2640670 RepID=UPI0006FBCDBD|nr:MULTISPECIES: GDSL-type esterase/lipase family protein [unclassified Phenylobacterium]KRB40616.1 hypothetical protein ASE02_07920 [Phenylobacterium sp. Root700]MBT9472532.1 hypothetical protein [Phenylobacterium sp.]